MGRFFSRADWGARPAKAVTKVAPWQRRYYVCHYSTGQELGREDCAQWVREIQQFHINGNGWSDIGYNELICKHGDRFEGRGLHVQGAHAGNPASNIAGYGVCFMGNDDPGVVDLTAVVQNAFILSRTRAEREFGHVLKARGHRDFKSTACPGDEIYRWVSGGMILQPEVKPSVPVKPKPKPTPVVEDSMDFLVKGDKRPHVYMVTSTGEKLVKRHVGEREYSLLRATGKAYVTVPQANVDPIPEAPNPVP